MGDVIPERYRRAVTGKYSIWLVARTVRAKGAVL